MDVGVRSLAGTTYEFMGVGTKLVLAVTGRLDEICVGKTLEDEGMGTLVIVALELEFHFEGG